MTSDPISPGKAMTLPPGGVGVGMTDDGNSTSAVMGLRCESCVSREGLGLPHAASGAQRSSWSIFWAIHGHMDDRGTRAERAIAIAERRGRT